MIKENGKKSVAFTILKTILIIVLCIILIFVGGYFYIKYSLGLDVGKFKYALDLLNKNYLQNQVVTEKFTNENTYQAFVKLFDTNEIFFEDGNGYCFNKEEFESSSLKHNAMLTNKEFAGLLNTFLLNYVKEIEILENIKLKQVSFSNLSLEEEFNQIDIKYTFEIEIYNFNTSEDVLTSFFSKYIPKKILLTSNCSLEFSNSDCFNYSFTNKNFKINNLCQEETNEVLEIFTSFHMLNFKEELVNSLDELFFNATFGGEMTDGIISHINDCEGYEFIINEGELFLKLKKV